MLTIGAHGAQTSQTYREPVVTPWRPGGLAIEATLGLKIRIHLESVESHLSVSLHQLLSNVTLRRCHLSTNAHDNNLGTASKLCIKSLKTVSGYS